MGDVVDIGTPSNDTVSTAKIQDDAVTTDKILDDAVTADKLANSINTEIAANTAKVTNATHTGDVTGATALTIAANAVTLAKLEDGTQGDILYYGASGAPARLGFGTSGDFLKTQGTGANPVWATAGGDNTPRFFAYFGSNEANPSDSTWTTIQYDTEDIDTDSAFDTSAYSFTVPVGSAGVYYLRAAFKGGTTVTTAETGMRIRKDGSSVLVRTFNNFRSNVGWSQQEISCIATLAEGDVITAQLFIDGTSGTIFYNGGTDRYTNFFGFKLL